MFREPMLSCHLPSATTGGYVVPIFRFINVPNLKVKFALEAVQIHARANLFT